MAVAVLPLPAGASKTGEEFSEKNPTLETALAVHLKVSIRLAELFSGF